MAPALRCCGLHAFVYLLSLLVPVCGQPPQTPSGVWLETFPQLQSLNMTTPTSLLGGQNFTWCCLLAINDSYTVQVKDLNVISTGSGFIDLTAEELEATQFPCGATYNGSNAGAPPVTIPYSWCKQNCGGWQKSRNAVLSQWVQPFVGFILPAAAFCLNIPRKKVLAIPNYFFEKGGIDKLTEAYNATITSIKNIPKDILGSFSAACGNFVSMVLTFVLLVLRASLAALFALIDTVVWIGIVFSTAGPMVLSGLYEATLDRKIIESLQEEESIPLNVRMHFLYAVLVGNLLLSPKPSGSPPEPLQSPPDSPEYLHDPSKSASQHAKLDPESSPGSTSEDRNRRDVWKDVESLVRLPGSDQARLDRYKNITETRLKGMLACQASFGAAIGAPVVFFLGSFLFSVISNLSAAGDNDTAHALAFGMWWMTIPHVAVVSGCLLAGNNPNTLEVIACGADETEAWPPIDSSHSGNGASSWYKALTSKWYKPFYATAYQPAWMWDRGRSKRAWIRLITDTNELVMDKYVVGKADWAYLIIFTLLLIGAPFVLAFLTSFYTPTVGMSCRSFTFLLYFLFQFWLSVIWFWDFLDERDRSVGWLTFSHQASKIKGSWFIFYWFVTGLGLIGSTFTALVGTFLQLLGAYRNCLCDIPMKDWSSKDASLVISTNTAASIFYAQEYWVPTGVTSIVLLIVVCYVGWWYQRHWRLRFNELIVKILKSRASVSPRGSERGMDIVEGKESEVVR